jgi:hypothetical protein
MTTYIRYGIGTLAVLLVVLGGSLYVRVTQKSDQVSSVVSHNETQLSAKNDGATTSIVLSANETGIATPTPKPLSIKERIALAREGKGEPVIMPMHSEYSADYSDLRYLMGYAHNVFVGKVIEKVGSANAGRQPATQFSVSIISNIKGNLSGNVIVTQDGRVGDGIITVSDSGILHPGGEYGGYFLQPGSTYIFPVRGPNENGWHQLNMFPGATTLLSENVNLRNEELQIIVRQSKRVNELEEIYPSEVLIESDITNNWAYNSFKSLPPEAMAAAQVRADAAKVWLASAGAQ